MLIQTIFADNTYSKPYYVTYINSSFFIIPLIPVLIKKWRDEPEEVRDLIRFLQMRKPLYSEVSREDERDQEQDLLPKPSDHSGAIQSDSDIESIPAGPRHQRGRHGSISAPAQSKMSLTETTVLALPFCFLWFFANYFSVACLEYTTVGSATILTSTSSIWTLICGTFVGVERFTIRKLLGVLASLAGVGLISSIDVSGGDNKDRGSFPHKTAREVAIGDILALISAVIYGVYCVVIKKRIGDESRVNMPMFFGLVGLLNIILMWPGFVILHFTGIEPFAMPPTAWIWGIIAINSTSSLISDYCWAFSMLLTSPLIVTVGLSLTIPLSLVGQMLLSATYTGWMYWLGAAVVVGSFVFINHEEKKDESLHESGVLSAHVLDRGDA
jgi:solute carrier family 35 protein F5